MPVAGALLDLVGAPSPSPVRHSPPPAVRHTLLVERPHGLVDGPLELGGIGEGPTGEMMRLEVSPDIFDVIEFGSIFGEPRDGEPMARAASTARDSLLVWIGPLSSTRTTGLAGCPGLGP